MFLWCTEVHYAFMNRKFQKFVGKSRTCQKCITLSYVMKGDYCSKIKKEG